MRIPDPAPPRTRSGNLLPMINVVFLLLIFFLISAEMTPPQPLEVAPPETATDAPRPEAAGLLRLFVDAEGQLGFQAARGPAALDALARARAAQCAETDCTEAPPQLRLHADAALAAATLADLLGKLGAMGFAKVDLITREARP
ncbi:ExbD/TolR family protein [Phaeovulum vinaykumarii]|uniref:Outer membrane transport energization protein ExbD n=1 Tax=Phaeovulum vinaykumarii TaxID=407234 RepID=A0A1N7JLD3_9RHOB|nr:biopolymer transporter ExbD [Phaeovulum vinaykumarii]SIS50173.1 outer membrane transport energization protein ExbD [Phaeovulum vinaykumarii]SOB90135.1 outer membrane transport energization protein ExbD [Phaeovulum vinaykumarii]